MIRKILEGLGYLLLAVLAIFALFAAFNWAMVRNMFATGGATISQIEKFAPREKVKGCPGPAFAFPQPDKAALSGVVKAMEDYSDSQNGRGLIVLYKGRLAYENYRGIARSAPTLSMSMHKTVVALMMGIAIRDGLIKSVDDPIGLYLDEWKSDPRGAITIRQLLIMSSGLHNASMSAMDKAAFDMMLSDHVTKTALASVSERAAGKSFNYNNADAQLAGTIIARALQKAGKGRYADYLSQSLWCPLGNGDASLWLEAEGGQPRYFAYLEAGLPDWARIGELIRNQGKVGDRQVIPAEWIAEMSKPSATNPGYGYFLWRGSPWVKARRYSKEVAMTVAHKEPYLADDVVFLDGFGGQRVYVVPSAQLVIARSGEVSMTWDDSVLVNQALRGLGRK